jgi:hypothetical protein
VAVSSTLDSWSRMRRVVGTSGPPRRSGPKAGKWVAIIPEIDREHPRGLGRDEEIDLLLAPLGACQGG